MKPDLYTKIVLTVIAGSLLAIAVRPLFQPPAAAAQQDALRVIVAGFDPSMRGLPVTLAGSEATPVPVTFVTHGGDNRGVPVNIVNGLVPVTVLGGGRDGHAAVAANVVQFGSRDVPDSLPVDITKVAGQNTTAEGIPIVRTR